MSQKANKLWRNDDELFVLARRQLFTAVVGDIMDQFGFQRQFLPAEIQPLRDDMVVIGRAMPVLQADTCSTDEGRNKSLREPFGLMLAALDDLQKNEVYLCAGATPPYALWGELMSIRAQKLGAVGAVMNGYSRDTRGIIELGFPVFSRGRYAQDQAPRGKVIDFRTPVQIGTVRVGPGDIVFGDLDGVCTVPRQVEREVFTKALEKARGEKRVRRALEEGMGARDAFRRFRIM